MNEAREYTFLRIDIADHSQLFRSIAYDRICRVLDDFIDFVEECTLVHSGDLWSWIGDGGLCAFGEGTPTVTVGRAYSTAEKILAALPEFNRKRSLSGEAAIRIRLAIHVGTATHRKSTGRIHSAAINFVSHLEARKTHPNTISISETARKELSEAIHKTFHAIGDFEGEKIFTSANDARIRRQLRAKYRVNLDPLAIERLGIADCIEDLENSSWAPKKCLRRMKKTMHFAGVFGHAWLKSEEHMRAIRKLLGGLGSHSEVQFLILNPYGSAAQKIAKARNRTHDPNHDARSLKEYVSLMSEYESFKVKVFNHLPHFRMLSVDQKGMAVSPFKLVKEAKSEWTGPHLILAPEPAVQDPETHLLYGAFNEYFAETWDNRSEDALKVWKDHNP